MEWVADRATAAAYVGRLLASYPQQAPVPEVYMEALIEVCMGRKEQLLDQMVKAILGKCKFLPSVAELKDWFDGQNPPTTWKALPPVEIEVVAPEERERRVNMLKAVAKEIRDCVKAKTVVRPSTPIQTHNPSRLLEALENLEAMTPKAETVE